MKVLLTTPTYPPFNSGMGNAVMRQAELLAQRGMSVVVVTSGSARHTRQDDAIRVEQFAVTGADRLLGNPIRGDVDGYVGFLQSESFDVAIMNGWQTWSTDVALRMSSKLAERKYVYSHGISTNVMMPYSLARSLVSYVSWRPYWWRLTRKMRQLDGVIFLADSGDDSRFDDLRLARRAGIPIYVIPNSLPQGPAHQSSTKRTQLIAVGSYTQAKGFDFVLDAYAKSGARNRVPLALFGQQHTKFSDVLKAQVKALDLDPAFVTLQAGVEGAELIKQYSTAKLVLSGSHTEAQPLVLLDAMATGTPFIARATGCISTMPGGLAVRTVEQASLAIDRLLNDSEYWGELSAVGLTAASETYSARRNADLLVALIEGRLPAEVSP